MLTIPQTTLRTLADHVAAAAARQGITATALVSVAGDALTITATDFDAAARASATGTASHDCAAAAVCIHAATLRDVVRAMPPGDVRLEVAADALALSAPGCAFTLAGIPAAEHPAAALTDTPDTAQVVALDAGALALTDYAMSDDPSRPAIAGLCVDASGVTATDGHRLAHAGAEPTDRPDGPSLLLHHRGVAAFAALLRAHQGAVVRAAGGHAWASVTVDGVDLVLQARRVDEAFPEWWRVVPSAAACTWMVDVDRDAAVAALRRVAQVSPDVVRLAGGDGALLLSGATSAGRVAVDVPAVVNGVVRELCAKPGYMIDALRPLGERVVIAGHDGFAPLRITSPGVDGVWVVMPMRV